MVLVHGDFQTHHFKVAGQLWAGEKYSVCHTFAPEAIFDTNCILYRTSKSVSCSSGTRCLQEFLSDLMLLRARGDSSVRVCTLNGLELSRLMVLRSLGSRQNIFLLVNVAEEEVLSRTSAEEAMSIITQGELTKSTVTKPPTMAGPPKSQTR